jgi:mannose/cellobiose epimerase-like protein (N-acyl-D-glucosamine 2-epimerase family)
MTLGYRSSGIRWALLLGIVSACSAGQENIDRTPETGGTSGTSGTAGTSGSFAAGAQPGAITTPDNNASAGGTASDGASIGAAGSHTEGGSVDGTSAQGEAAAGAHLGDSNPPANGGAAQDDASSVEAGTSGDPTNAGGAGGVASNPPNTGGSYTNHGGATSNDGGATSNDGGATSSAQSGGADEISGTSSGGIASGGTSSNSSTGGVSSGGIGSGSTSTGGTSTGGTSTGGTSTGGTSTGGTSTGGASTTYAPKSEYLINPDHAVSVIKSLADFRAKSRDDANGGFFSFVNLDGRVSSDRRKGFVTMSRDAWTFSRTFMVTGDERYLEQATHALAYLYAHGWDNENGGWFFTSDEFGKLTPFNQYWDPNTWKWSFVQHYALLGIGAYCDVARDATACGWMQKGEDYLENKMWDSNLSQLGYFDQTDLNSSNPRNKGFTPTVDALTTNAIQAELLWPTTHHQRMVDLANIVVDRLATAMDSTSVKFGFPENYGSNWSVDTGQTGADVGHVLKSAWVLARVYLRNPDPRYRAAARKFIYEVLDNGGWDQTEGVPYTHYDWRTGQVTQQAESWQIEQAVTSGLSNYYIADDSGDKDAFLEMADRALQFYDAYVIDHERGGTYKLNDISGNPIDGKSNFYNVEYHSAELFYFTYVYGNLLLHRTPIALYYMIPATSSEQVIQLNPVAVDDASLQIQSVTLDGAPLTSFTAPTREVTLAAGQGGKLHVVFAPAPH